MIPIIGPSDAGKCTLLRLINGTRLFIPSSGRALRGNADVTAQSGGKLRACRSQRNLHVMGGLARHRPRGRADGDVQLTLYFFELNVRLTSILGIVGARYTRAEPSGTQQ